MKVDTDQIASIIKQTAAAGPFRHGRSNLDELGIFGLSEPGHKPLPSVLTMPFGEPIVKTVSPTAKPRVVAKALAPAPTHHQALADSSDRSSDPLKQPRPLCCAVALTSRMGSGRATTWQLVIASCAETATADPRNWSRP